MGEHVWSGSGLRPGFLQMRLGGAVGDGGSVVAGVSVCKRHQGLLIMSCCVYGSSNVDIK